MASPTLYDWTGRPVDLADLRREQAGPTAGGVRSVLDPHLLDALSPMRMASILRDSETPGYGAAEAYLELAERMEEKDLHYLGVLGTRKNQVAQIGVRIEPTVDTAEGLRDADLVRDFFERDEIEDELFDILDAVGKGFSVTEIDWETSARQWMPRRLVHRLPRWFDFDPDTGTSLRVRTEGGWEPLAPWRFLTCRIAAKSGLPIRGGLARAAAWSWILRTYTLRDWVRFVEAYGQPLRIGKFPQGTNPQDKAILYRAVRDVAADGAAIIPESMKIEFVGDDRPSARSEIYRDLIAYLDSRVSIAVLGQTLTTEQGDRGSQALGNVHNEVRQDIERADGKHLAASLRRDLVVPIIALNHGPRERYPKVFIQREPATDLKLLERLVPLGLRVRADEVRTRLRLAKPADDDEVLEAPGGMAIGRSRPRSRPATARFDQSAITRVIDAIDADEWERLAAPVIQPVLARAADDPDGMLDDLAALYPAMDVDALADRLARILFVAETWGRLTADD